MYTDSIDTLNEYINDLLHIDNPWQNSKYHVRQVKELHKDYTISRYHQFITPHITNGGYRSIVSMSAFFHGIKKYNYTPNGVIYYLMDDRIDDTTVANDRNNLNIGPYQIFQHESIWDFYDFIKWNWKKKKWNM